MKLLLLFLIFNTPLAGQKSPKVPKGFKPNPTAEWMLGKWVCPEGYRLPPAKDLPVYNEKKKVSIPCLSPPSQQPQWHALDPHGIWDAPRTAWDSVRESLFGKLTWKHYRVSYMPLPGRLYCKVENMTHHLPYYFDHDPHNLVLTPTSFEFDAVAGDSISWKVWSLP